MSEVARLDSRPGAAFARARGTASRSCAQARHRRRSWKHGGCRDCGVAPAAGGAPGDGVSGFQTPGLGGGLAPVVSRSPRSRRTLPDDHCSLGPFHSHSDGRPSRRRSLESGHGVSLASCSAASPWFAPGSPSGRPISTVSQPLRLLNLRRRIPAKPLPPTDQRLVRAVLSARTPPSSVLRLCSPCPPRDAIRRRPGSRSDQPGFELRSMRDARGSVFHT